MKAALDSNDRWMAAVAWAGWLFGGPLLPVVVLAVSWSNRESLARLHSTVASIVWIVAVLVWLPVLAFGIVMQADDPDPLAVLMAVFLGVAMVILSIVGGVVALRAPVAVGDL